MDRRAFVQTSAALAGAGVTGLACDRAVPREPTGRSLERVGLQLYTVRGPLGADFDGTLERVASIGYDEVEFAGYYDRSPREIRATLDRLGMSAPAAHLPLGALRESRTSVFDAALEIGHQYLIVAFLTEAQRPSPDAYRQIADQFNEIGAACRSVGLRFAYHNHDFEFVPLDGEVPYDILLERCDPAAVEFEMDLFWIREAGRDPMEYFENAPGRFRLCHVKDMTADGSMTDVGAGVIDFGAIFARAPQAGLQHFFVEHDNPPDPLSSIEASYNHLRALEY